MCPGQVGIFGDIDREGKWAQNSRFSEFLQRPEALNGPSGIGWKENSCTTRTSQSLHQTAASQRKIICVENSSKGRFFWNLNCRKYVARTRSWLLTKPLLVSFTPKIFRLPIQAKSLNNQQCSGEKYCGIFCFKMDETKYCWKAGFCSPISDSFHKWFHRHLV